MFDFHEKRKLRGLLYSKLTIGILLILVVLLAFSVIKRFSVERTIAEKREIKEEEFASLEERAAMLERRVEYLQHQRGIEEELRTRFDVAKEGEQVVIIVDNGTGNEDIQNLASPPGATSEKKPFWDIFFFWR